MTEIPQSPAANAEPFRCQQCGTTMSASDLACSNCGAFVHRAELERLSAEALRLEPVDPMAAARIWQQSLSLVPTDSQQYRMMAQRIPVLASKQIGLQPISYEQREAGPGTETLQSILFKTGGSMLLSIALYSQMFGGWKFAIGFVLLIFIHEMGHVTANWYYGIKQSAPIFLGIFGAVIFIRGRIRSAWEEAVMGIAGPVFGSIPAIACYIWYKKTGHELVGVLAWYGLFINFFNLLPLPPLDGGRASAAISPWLWLLGVAGVAFYVFTNIRDSLRSGGHFSPVWLFILFWILSQTWTRLRETLLGGMWRSDYYRVGTARRIAMFVVYGGLAIVLYSCLSDNGLGRLLAWQQ